MQEIFCVIMAGGSGERFWPKSRKRNPKQLLTLFGKLSLLEQTVSRLSGFVPPENILIITNRLYVEKIQSLCPKIPYANIVGEPCARDTAPCIALASGIVKAKAKTENPLMIVLPSDHYIQNKNAMISDLKEAGTAAMRENAIVTVGIPPVYPCVDYGYIECGESVPGYNRIFRAVCFLEKPTLKKAKELFRSNRFKWNSGFFLFSLKRILNEFSEHAEDMAELLTKTANSFFTENFKTDLEFLFTGIRKISFDYAVMEHADNILTKDASFDWDDVGNWNILRNYWPKDENGNVVSGPVCLQDCEECIVYADGDDQLVTGVGLKNLVIVRTPDAILIANSTSTPRIKALLKKISETKSGKKYL